MLTGILVSAFVSAGAAAAAAAVFHVKRCAAVWLCERLEWRGWVVGWAGGLERLRALLLLLLADTKNPTPSGVGSLGGLITSGVR